MGIINLYDTMSKAG